MKRLDKADVPYYGVMNSKIWRQALRKVAADEGLTMSALIHRAVKAARPDVEEIAARFGTIEAPKEHSDDH